MSGKCEQRLRSDAAGGYFCFGVSICGEDRYCSRTPMSKQEFLVV